MIAPDLVAAHRAYKLSQYRQQPCHSNRASALGGDCERHLVYLRTAWRDAQRPSDDLILIFQEGDKHEREVLIELQRAGVRVIEQQVSLEWKKYEITGHIDATIVDGEESIPLDVKTMSPHIWDSIFRRGHGCYEWDEVSEEFQKKRWTRKYAGQIYLYCLMKNCERGILLCLNKATGALAQVTVPLDYVEAERLISRAERVNAHIAAGTLPDRIPYDPDVCGYCEFLHVCLPDHVGMDPFRFVDDRLVEEWLEAHEENRDGKLEYDRVHAKLLSWVKAQKEDNFSIGRWLVRVNRGARISMSIEALETATDLLRGKEGAA